MSITAANATILLSVATIFPAPQQLQGFAADDVYDSDVLASTEVLMGVDGNLSGGFVFAEWKQNIALQADSPSVPVFDQWWAQQAVTLSTYPATAVIYLPDLGKKYTLSQGFLTGYKPLPDAKKLLQPQKFAITWGRFLPQIGSP